MQDKKMYFETLHCGYGQYFEIDKMLFEEQTDSWNLSVFENHRFGRVMALNGAIQTTERDEFVYHEMLTHVPLLAHGSAKRVLIIGGGDGGMLREVVKHQSIDRIVMVEIDAKVVSLCQAWFPNHSAGAFDDPRVELVIGDGMEYVAHCDEQFDVIISDCTDPVGPGEVLFSSDFYAGCKRCLTPNGIFVAQNGVPFMQLDTLQDTVRRMSSYTRECWFFNAAVPTYVGGTMAFAWATDNIEARKLSLATLEARFIDTGISTRYYTPALHQASFALPHYVEQAIRSAMTVNA